MITAETAAEYQVLADDVLTLIHERLAAAVPVEVLSDDQDKLLQVVQEPDGKLFVRRSFTESSVRRVEGWTRPSFTQSWENMRTMYDEVGIEVVPSVLLEQVDEYPFVAISEYLGQSLDMLDVPTLTKNALAHNLGQIIKQESGYLPATEALRSDMFHVSKQQDDTLRVVLVDVDPYITSKTGVGADISTAFFISRLGSFFWNEWCAEGERQEVVESFEQSVFEALQNSNGRFTPLSLTGQAFMNLTLMRKGFDLKQLRS